jgi:hypothetical protein
MQNKLQMILVALAALLVAGPALAATSVHEDLIQMGDLGYVGSGETLDYQHEFEPALDPGISISSIDSATLSVGIFDDSSCSSLSGCFHDWFLEAEVATIDLEGIHWATGQATARVFFGDITAHADLILDDGLIDISIRSESGDFVVAWSLLTTTYTYEVNGLGTAGGGSGSPMPEPSAALMFAVGALFVQRRVRRGLAS